MWYNGAMVKKLIIANWKMNPQTLKEAESLFLGIAKTAQLAKNAEVVICTPFVFLSDLKRKNIKKLLLGAQNVFFEKQGAYTGEISALMLKSFGVKYVIVGHSERRAMGEKDELISKKTLAVIKAGLTPILCVGEKVRDASMEYLSVVRKQLVHSLHGIPKASLKKIIIAYEPVWAIGKNAIRETTSGESREMSIFIKKIISDLSDPKTAHEMKILYGGSVNAKNSEEFLTHGGVDGLLVGGASLKIKEFSKIIINAEKIK